MFTAVGTSRVSARQPTYFSCFAKRSRQEKATLRWRSALRADCTRRQHLKREASETRFAQTADASLSVSGTGDASPSNGISLQRQLQLQLSLRGATSNRNGRCAANGKSNSSQAEKALSDSTFSLHSVCIGVGATV